MLAIKMDISLEEHKIHDRLLFNEVQTPFGSMNCIKCLKEIVIPHVMKISLTKCITELD